MVVKKIAKKEISAPKKGAKPEETIEKKTKISPKISKELLKKEQPKATKEVVEKSNLVDKLDLFRDCEVKNGTHDPFTWGHIMPVFLDWVLSPLASFYLSKSKTA